MAQQIVAASILTEYHTGYAAAQTMIAAILEDGETGLGFAVEWTARNQLKPAPVAKNLGLVELSILLSKRLPAHRA